MSRLIKTHKTWLLPLVLTAVVFAIGIPALSQRRQNRAPQEIVLFARDVSFWLPDQPEQPNPPLHLTRGRPVRLILRNDEPEKILHCFTIGAFDVESTRDLARGESEVLTFTPTHSGTFTYACLMHPMMAGKIVVE